MADTYWTLIHKRGRRFLVTTLDTGVAPGNLITTAPAFSLWNPPGSGVVALLKNITTTYRSGTFDEGSLIHVINAPQLTALTGGLELTPIEYSGSSPYPRAIRVWQQGVMSAVPIFVATSLTTANFGQTGLDTGFAASSQGEIPGPFTLSPGRAIGYTGLSNETMATARMLITYHYDEVPL